MRSVNSLAQRHRYRHAQRIRMAACFLLALCGLEMSVASSQELNSRTTSQSSPEVSLDRLGNTSLTLIRQSARLLADQQWDEAIEVVRGIVRTDGNRLIAVNPGKATTRGQYYLTVQQYAQGWFASLGQRAPEALVRYRRQVDPLARRWFIEARKTGDRALLQRIVDELFASSYGDDALLLLGEYCLEQGDYAGARFSWEQIFPQSRGGLASDHQGAVHGRPLWMQLRFLNSNEAWEAVMPALQSAPARRPWLTCPDSDLEQAAIFARLVLVSIMERHDQRARRELEYLKRLYPDEQGRLAARTGSYVKILEDLLARSARWKQAAAGTDWSTFAGTVTRSATPARSIDIRHVPVWFQSLQHWSAEQELMSLVRPRIAEDMQGLLSCFPVIHRQVVYVNEQTRIRAFRLGDGSPAWNPADETGTIFDSGIAQDQLHLEGKHYGVVRGTLTVHQNRLFAKVGSPVSVMSQRADPLVHPTGYLVGLDLDAEGKLLPGFPLRPDGPDWAFEGAPVIDGNQLYVGMRRRDQVRSHAYLACFGLDSGRLRWRVLICSAETPGQGQWPEITHHLVTLDHGMLYYNTNAGAIAAVRAADGVIRWLTTYPRMTFRAGAPEGAGNHFFRDLNPCLLHRGILMVAPSDSQQVFALEAATGAMLWQEQSGKTSDIVHLLGVVGDDLVASGDYLYWLDLYNGHLRRQFPAAVDADLSAARPDPRGLGRGLIAGGEVYWPTREAIYVFRRDAGKAAAAWKMHRQIALLPRGVSGGHLLISNDRLLLVTANRLFAFRND